MIDPVVEEPQGSSVSAAIEAAIKIGLIALLMVWSFTIIRPFLVPIIWGVIIAIGTFPLYRRLLHQLNGRRGLAATILSLVLAGLIVMPAVVLGTALLESAQELARGLRDGTLEIPPPSPELSDWPLVGPQIHEFWELAAVDLREALQSAEAQVKALARWMLGLATKFVLALLQFVFAIIISGLLLVRAEGGGRVAEDILVRLAGTRGHAMIVLAHGAVQSVVRGILGVALLQATLAGLGFLIAGVPGAGLWAFLCLVLAIVQIGMMPILLGVSIYMFGELSTPMAVAFLVWNIAVGILDNVLKPLVLGRGVRTPMLVILLGAIGGLVSMGILGLFIGPVILVMSYELFRAWMAQPGAAP